MDIFGVKALKKLVGKHRVDIGDLEKAVYSYNWPEGFPEKEIIPEKNEKRLNQHQADLDILAGKVDSIEPTVECETCGCLLRKATAYRSESVIVDARSAHKALCGMSGVPEGWVVEGRETIRERYYCKVHKKGKK